jgi:N-acetylglutamate synthase-like GNAT family acetyltransferase
MLASTQPRQATKGDLPRILKFLEENGLPDVGVDECVENFVIAESESGSWIGVAGVEFYDESGLLRSVAVDEHFRGRGHGRILVNAILGNARDRGIKTVYLLTEDADNYFKQLGFQIVDRKDVDDVVQRSLEFTEACPESALVMRKAID